MPAPTTPLVPIEQLLFGIREVETGGRKNPYQTVNEIGAHGAYQVMRAYIGPWTKEALGRAYTPAQFLADPAAQDKVARFRLERDMKKYKSWESAAAVWFSGRPDPDSMSDDGAITVRAYVKKVREAMGRWKPGAGGGGTSTTPAGLPSSDIADAMTGGLVEILRGIGTSVGEAAESVASMGKVAQMLMSLALPTTWTRILTGLLGGALLLAGLIVLGREAKGTA